MKKLLLLTISMLFLVFGFITYVSFTEDGDFSINLSDYDIRGINKSLAFFTPMLADKNGEFKDSYYHKARKQADAFKNNRAAKSEFLEWEELGPNNVGGRTRAILVDNKNSDLIYAGGVSGGLWISRNGSETWEQYVFNEQLPLLAIGTITQDKDGLIYFSTGEPAHGTNSASVGGFVPGEGIFKLTGPDAMFEQLASTKPSEENSSTVQWSRINRVVVSPTDPSILFAALDGFALQRSKNGGNSWTLPNGIPEGTPSTKYDAFDVEFSADGQVVYATIESKIYKSVDKGNNFEAIEKGVRPDGKEINLRGEGRTELAISPTNSNFVYASFIQSNGRMDRVLRTIDGGTTWEQIGKYDPDFFRPFGFNGQGWYDHALKVDPQNPERIFLGGVTLWSWSDTDGWRRLDNFGSSSTNPYYVHADKHEFEFDPKDPDRLFIAGDGGIFRTLKASDKNPFFIPRNKNYNVTQFYSVGASYEGRVVGGAQDNGTSYIDYIGTSTQGANHIFGGDGGYSEISDISPNMIFAATQELGFFRSANSGGSFGEYLDPTCTGAEFFQDQLFITPYHLWEDFDLFKITYNRWVQETLVYNEELKIYQEAMENGEENLVAPVEPADPVKNGIIYSGGTKVFAAVDALNPSGVSDCFIIAAFPSGVLSGLGLSKDGKTLWAGSTQGELVRVNGLDQDPETALNKRGWRFNGIDDDTNADKFLYTDDRYTKVFKDLPFDGEYVTGINVNPNNIDQVVVTTGGFGNDENIFISTNARSSSPKFESIQGEGPGALPAMPVYEAIFDESIQSGNIIHAATELGVWTYRKSAKRWEEANEGIGRVRTLRIRQEPMNSKTCPVIYLATHGRGAFRSALGAKNKGCEEEVKLPVFIVGTEDNVQQVKHTLNIYPNPITDVAKVDFNLQQSAQIKARVLSVTGQLMQDYNFGKYGQGNHSVEIERGNLAAGTYILALQVNRELISKQIIIAD